MKKKIGVVGHRKLNDACYPMIKEILDCLQPFHLISGGAKGADSLAERYADEKGYPKTIHKAKWDKYGKAAGPIRNGLIVKDSDLIIGFMAFDSKGTKNCSDQAAKAKVPFLVQFLSPRL